MSSFGSSSTPMTIFVGLMKRARSSMWPSVSSPSMPPVEPADVLLAVVVLQVLLDLLLRELRVAVLVEQAVGGGQHGAGAVEVDRAAFHDDALRDRTTGSLNSFLGDPRRHRVVIVVRRILPAPGVEAPVDDRRLRLLVAPCFSTNAGPWSRHQLSLVLMWWKKTFRVGQPCSLSCCADDVLPVLVRHVDVHLLARLDLAHDPRQILRHRVILPRKRNPLRPRPAEPRAACGATRRKGSRARRGCEDFEFAMRACELPAGVLMPIEQPSLAAFGPFRYLP